MRACATHVLAYAAVSEHVNLTHPELFKMMWMTLRKNMTKNYPHEFQRLGVVALTAGQETASAAAACMARASGQPS